MLRLKWHQFWIQYHESLLEGCLCEHEKTRIVNKILLHKGKILSLTANII